MDIAKLTDAALTARRNSYSPYSKYMVGAAVLCRDGSIFTGTNIENASYGATVCAERVAVFSAVAAGHKDITAIAVCGGASDETDVMSDYAYPCGICRQVIREFADPAECIVIVARSADDHRKYKLEDLLPDSFGPDNLRN